MIGEKRAELKALKERALVKYDYDREKLEAEKLKH